MRIFVETCVDEGRGSRCGDAESINSQAEDAEAYYHWHGQDQNGNDLYTPIGALLQVLYLVIVVLLCHGASQFRNYLLVMYP